MPRLTKPLEHGPRRMDGFMKLVHRPGRGGREGPVGRKKYPLCREAYGDTVTGVNENIDACPWA